MFLVFLALMIVSAVVVHLVLGPQASQKQTARRMEIISASRKNTSSDEMLAPADAHTDGFAHRLGIYVQRFHFADKLKLLLLYSGSKATVGSIVVTSASLALGAAFAAHVTMGAFPVDLLACAGGGCVPWGFLRFQKGRRMKKFNAALVDAIDLIARALRAGHSINSAIEVVAEQSAEPLGSEFAIVFQQQKFGIPFRDAILQLGERIPSKDLHFLITAILVQKETGGDLTDVLDRTARVIRERIRIEGEIQTYTAQGRLTGWILGSLPVVMLVLINIITPGYSHILFHDPLGRALLYAGATLILFGGLIIRKIVDIKV